MSYTLLSDLLEVAPPWFSMGHLCHTDHGSPGGRHPGNYLHVKRWDFGERFGSRSLGGSPGARGICSYFQWKPSGATEWSFPTTSKRRTEKTHRNPQNVPGEFSHGFPWLSPKKVPSWDNFPSPYGVGSPLSAKVRDLFRDLGSLLGRWLALQPTASTAKKITHDWEWYL